MHDLFVEMPFFPFLFPLPKKVRLIICLEKALLCGSRAEDEFEAIKQEMFLAKKEGRIEDIMKLHKALKDGVNSYSII